VCSPKRGDEKRITEDEYSHTVASPRVVRAATIATAIAAFVLGYGYWFGATHGSLYVSADDVSIPQRVRPVVPLRVTFFDRKHEELSQAETLPPWNAIVLTSPAAYACHDQERSAASAAEARERWQTCFEGQSRWLTTWMGRADHADLETTGCHLERVPLSIERRGDNWWLWWVPLPHIGGKPYTSFNVRLALDVANCRIVTS